FNNALYDVLMGVLWDKDKNQVMAARDSLREGWIDLLANNTDFNKAILLGTSAKDMVRLRFDLAREWIEDTLRQHRKQRRCFSLEWKKSLFDANPTCALCEQGISEIDDAAVDHIEQYWRGGQTIPENSRLTHRYCNWARPRGP
ncbi:MAG: HNH endonuclease, partial [Limisphaerales bacterium]